MYNDFPITELCKDTDPSVMMLADGNKAYFC